METKKTKIRRLFWDIEVTPNLVWSWRIGNRINLSHDNIVEERRIICIAYMWEGDKAPKVLKWKSYKDGDREMIKEFLEVAKSADEMVAQYGDGFDVPWFKARCLIHGLGPLPDLKTIDTKEWAARGYMFNSNRLDYLADILGFGKKLKTDFALWLDVIRGDEQALKYMCKYCAIDVVRLSQVYGVLAQNQKPKTHVGVLNGGEKWSCPRCGSKNVKLSKKRVTANGTVQYQMQCRADGSYFTISQKAYNDYQEYLSSK